MNFVLENSSSSQVPDKKKNELKTKNCQNRQKIRLKKRTVESKNLSQNEIKLMFDIYQPYYNVKFEEFYKRSLNNFDKIIIHETKSSHEIVGFVGIRITKYLTKKKKHVRLVYFGQMFVKEEFRGRNLMQKSAISLLFSSKFSHPRYKAFLWGDVISVQSYLMLVRNMKYVYPVNIKNAPNYLKEVQDFIGFHYYPQYYNSKTGCVNKPFNILKHRTFKIDEKDQSKPEVQQFMRLNPGWEKGDGLIMIGPIDIIDIIQNGIRHFKKQFRKRKKNKIK